MTWWSVLVAGAALLLMLVNVGFIQSAWDKPKRTEVTYKAPAPTLMLKQARALLPANELEWFDRVSELAGFPKPQEPLKPLDPAEIMRIPARALKKTINPRVPPRMEVCARWEGDYHRVQIPVSNCVLPRVDLIVAERGQPPYVVPGIPHGRPTSQPAPPNGRVLGLIHIEAGTTRIIQSDIQEV